MRSIVKDISCLKRILLVLLLFPLTGIPYWIKASPIHEKARIQYHVSILEQEGLAYEERMSSYDSILSFYEKNSEDNLWARYAVRQMEDLYKTGKYIEAYKLGVEITNKIDENPSLSEEINENRVKMLASRCCSNSGMYDESVSFLQSIISRPNNEFMAEAYSQLGFVFTLMNQYEKARSYHLLALKALENPGAPIQGKPGIYNNLAGYYYANQQTDSALHYLNLTIESYDATDKDSPSKGFVFNNMAMIYQQMKEFAIADKYYSLAMDIARDEPYTYALAVKNKAYLLFEMNKLDEAEEYYHEAIDASGKVNALQIKMMALMELAELYHETGRYKKAWDYLKEGTLLKDSVISNQNMERVFLLSQQLDNYKILAEKELLEKDLQMATLQNEKNKIIIQISILALIIISAITILLLRYSNRRSLNRMKKESLDNEKEMRYQYEASLEEKNRKLASNALFLMKTDEIINNLEREAIRLDKSEASTEQKAIIGKMLTELSSYNSAKGWDEFKYYFEEVHHSFYNNLDKINPELTNMEQRLCALLVLNLNTKEIAQITNRSVRTIETLIYRLRKNLGVPPEEKTVQYLRRFLEE